MNLTQLVQMLVAIATTLARHTKTQVDDVFAEVAQAIANSPELIKLLEKLLQDPQVLEAKGNDRSAAIRTFAAAQPIDVAKLAISWQTLLDYLPAIVRLLLSLTGKR